MQVGATHAIRIWTSPLGIFQNIKHADQPTNKMWQSTTSACCLCWTALVGNNSLWKMYVCAICWVQC